MRDVDAIEEGGVDRPDTASHTRAPGAASYSVVRNLLAGIILLAGAGLLATEFGLRGTAPLGIPIRPFAKLALGAGGAGWAGLALLHRLAGAARAAETVANAALLVGFTAAALLLGEGLARFGLRDVTSVFDGRYYPSVRWEREHPIPHNRLGFRERELPEALDPGAYRIAVVGDGFLHTQAVAEEDVLTRILERKLNATGPGRFQVLNFGRGGAQTDDEIGILLDPVLGFEPDFVLLQWFVNDPEGEDPWGPPTWNVPGTRLLESQLGFRAKPWLRRHSALFFLVAHKMTAIGMAANRWPTWEEHVEWRLGDPSGDAAKAADASLRAFFRTARGAGTPVGLFAFPLIEEVRGDRERYTAGFLLDRVMATCSDEGVPCVDLREVLADVIPASDLWVNRLDGHPGRGANERVAEALVERFGPIWIAAAAAKRTGRPVAGSVPAAGSP